MTAALRLRMLPRFPARITGTDGVKVVRVSGSPDLTVSLDFASLGDVAGIPDPATNYFAMYDTETGAYYRIPFQSMFDAAGVSAGYPTRAAAELANIPVPIRNVRIKISSGYTASTDWLGRTGYPASGNYIGAGLSGNVGALWWGWGRDCSIENVTLDGSLDAYFMFARAICAGDVGTTVPTGAATGLRGQNILTLDHTTGSVAAMFDCPAGITDANFRSRMEGFRMNAAPTALGGANAVALNNVFLEIGNRDGTKIRGRLAEMVTRNVTLSTFQQDLHLVGGMSIGAGYGSVGVRDGWTNDGQIWRASAATTAATTKMGFYNPNGLVGQIQTSLTATAYVTSSDETWKDFIGAYDQLKAIDIIRRDPVRDFHWKEDRGGTYAVGWGAQTSHAVSSDLAVPGGWFNPLTNEPCNEGDTWEVDLDEDGVTELVVAIYVPWGVDQSKRTPYLWAAVSWLLDQQEILKAEIEALKTR